MESNVYLLTLRQYNEKIEAAGPGLEADTYIEARNNVWTDEIREYYSDCFKNTVNKGDLPAFEDLTVKQIQSLRFSFSYRFYLQNKAVRQAGDDFKTAATNAVKAIQNFTSLFK